ncbi:MAG TPA: VOC family protein [Thermoanaerobaculia bacterium]|jgi:uncharacterized glyoxalase superfamily protein PhnB|nr:VOC family protein [Thermoanaerobaculia bacterium]
MSETNRSEDYYPMPSFPTLDVKDLPASARWYQEALGFRHVFSIPGPTGQPALVHLRWTRYADLLLRQDPSGDLPAVKGKGVTLTFNLLDGGSVDELAARARQHGATLVSEPKNQPWNARDFRVTDPDGFTLCFSQGPVDPGLGMERILARSAGKEE